MSTAKHRPSHSILNFSKSTVENECPNTRHLQSLKRRTRQWSQRHTARRVEIGRLIMARLTLDVPKRPWPPIPLAVEPVNISGLSCRSGLQVTLTLQCSQVGNHSSLHNPEVPCNDPAGRQPIFLEEISHQKIQHFLLSVCHLVDSAEKCIASRDQNAPAESHPSFAKHSITSIGIFEATGQWLRLRFLSASRSIATA